MVAERCYELVIRLYDCEGLWYVCDNGVIIKHDDGRAEGYICDDYITMIPQDDHVDVMFYNYMNMIKLGFPAKISMEFPRTYRINIDNFESISTMEILVGKEIMSQEKCAEALDTIKGVKVVYNGW